MADHTFKANALRSSKVAEEAAEIAFGAMEVANSASTELAASEQAQIVQAVAEQCMGIIDSGATASLG